VNSVYSYYAKCENVPNCTPLVGNIVDSVEKYLEEVHWIQYVWGKNDYLMICTVVILWVGHILTLTNKCWLILPKWVKNYYLEQQTVQNDLMCNEVHPGKQHKILAALLCHSGQKV
jgi:hypothetical protein